MCDRCRVWRVVAQKLQNPWQTLVAEAMQACCASLCFNACASDVEGRGIMLQVVAGKPICCNVVIRKNPWLSTLTSDHANDSRIPIVHPMLPVAIVMHQRATERSRSLGPLPVDPWASASVLHAKSFYSRHCLHEETEAMLNNSKRT